jgi:hypothetical protein
MIGLPGDGLPEVWATLRYLKELCVDRIDAFLLQVLPGTKLALMAAGLGIEHDACAPYYVRSTPSLTYQQLQLALRVCGR